MTWLIDIERLQNAEVPRCKYCNAPLPVNGFDGLLAMVRHGLGHGEMPASDRALRWSQSSKPLSDCWICLQKNSGTLRSG